MSPSRKLKILFVTPEVLPFVKTGGLADVSAALPQKLQELGHQVRIVVPKYGAIDERKYKIHEVVRLKDLTVNLGEKEVVFSLRSSFLEGQRARVQIYFLDNDDYFGTRHSLYNDPISGDPYPDNDERFILLAKSVFELISKLGWVPDIIHCNDWQCGLIPVMLKKQYSNLKELANVKTLFTIHNLGDQGEFDLETFAKTGLPEELKNEKYMLHNGKVNFMKSGLLYSDIINTVSENYAQEICNDVTYGAGLHKILSKRKEDIFGIINGIDVKLWDPEKDNLIVKNYSIKNIEDKAENKKHLVEKFGLEFNEEIPVIGIISRLTDNKGFDLIRNCFSRLMELNIQLVVLGTGEKKYHQFLEESLFEYSDKFGCYLGYDEELAHLIEAGSDMFLMPSRFEPCGLNQMYSLVYGTVPIVRSTGGLADTIKNFNGDETGNGFVFKEYSCEGMMKEIMRAVKIFKEDKKSWQKLIKTGMKSNFNWLDSSKNYVDLYKELLN
jgi:starch synthase